MKAKRDFFSFKRLDKRSGWAVLRKAYKPLRLADAPEADEPEPVSDEEAFSVSRRMMERYHRVYQELASVQI